MRRNFKFILLIFCALLAFFGMQKGRKAKKHKQKSSLVIHDEKPFVVIIPSYNNSSFVEKNLRSVFSQFYKNYRVIYIDDHSSDDTYTKAKKFTGDLEQTHRTTLIQNEKNQGALANLYHAIHSCQDHEIIVLVDGDDFLAHEHVLTTLNQKYQDPTVWMTYGNFLDYPTYKQTPVCCKKIPERIIMNNGFRKHEWVTTHLRTFYASLFKKICLQDMIHRGRFFPMGWDLAFMIPMLEMSGPHVKFIPDTLYLYNRNNPLSDHKINFAFQKECADAVRNKKPYNRLQELTVTPSTASKKGEVVVFSSGHSLSLHTLLESLHHHVHDVSKISVICPKTKQLDDTFEELQEDFPTVHFIFTNDFQSSFQKFLQDSPLETSSHLLLTSDNLIVKEIIYLSDAIEILEKTKGYGLYFGLGTNLQTLENSKSYQELPPLISLKNVISKDTALAWQLSLGNGDWKGSSPFDLVLYSKEALRKALIKKSFKDVSSLQNILITQNSSDKLGIIYSQPKCIKNN